MILPDVNVLVYAYRRMRPIIPGICPGSGKQRVAAN